MFTNNFSPINAMTASLDIRSQRGRQIVTNWALQLYRRVSLLGSLSRVLGKITKKQSQLIDLNRYAGSLSKRGQHYAGIKAVSIQQIRGTYGKGAEFDARFVPLNERSRSRWLGVAMARLQGTPLPPVELIQVGETYFVIDGHHRISVAKAFGEQMIDAEITVWNVNGPLPWEKNTSQPVLSSQMA